MYNRRKLLTAIGKLQRARMLARDANAAVREVDDVILPVVKEWLST